MPCRHSPRAFGTRLAVPGFSLSAVVLAMALTACAARPGPETLDPIPSSLKDAKSITILAATDRAPAQVTPPIYGVDRGILSYEAITMLEKAPNGGPYPSVHSPDTDPSGDFVATERRALDETAFARHVARMRKKGGETIVIFVHGYNYSYQEAVFRLAQLSAEAGQTIIPVLFSWPSQASVAGYVADRDSTTFARDDLARLLVMLGRARPGGRIAVVGHSMGAWLVMEALRQLRLEGENDVIAHLQVGLAAPDIDIDVFRKQAAAVGRLSSPLTVLVSADDRALAISSRLAGGRPRLGSMSVDDPRILDIVRSDGMRFIDITTMPASDGFNHDRFIAFAARYSDAARDGGLPDGIRQAGVYLLDTTGRVLSAPFTGAARIVAGSQ
ncbi:conserved exported hypothetical protein [uncultured Pleomorphomonas sp.]|uniref:Alpha/beta fold hydrolase n=1 Tax=uncultured Pleomorphomonas sp. TaxID=442121 RepID=A0A212L3D1_9HYPH|nr:conserved exported hypothetical protein [uncultured Pleomorphomonas sp.]